MRHGTRWTWVLALGAGLGLASLTRADDDEAKPPPTGNWFTRLFTPPGAAKKKDDKTKKDAAAGPVSPALVRQKAFAEWQRRVEVCYKLKQIALETGDQDLDRKADALDRRAWEVYVQRTGTGKGNPSLEDPFPDADSGTDAGQRVIGPNRVGTAVATGDERNGTRRD
jgi:hypothetical protein